MQTLESKKIEGNIVEILKAEKEQNEILLCSKQAAIVSTKIAKLFLDVLKVQPKVTSVNTGMGLWCFDGKGIGYYNEIGEEGLVEFDAMELEGFAKNPIGCYYDVSINNSLIQIVDLLNYLCTCDEDSLNCSTWQSGFDKNGIIFTYSEIENKTGNPFSVPTREYFINSDYYRFLVRHKCPISWKIENNKT